MSGASQDRSGRWWALLLVPLSLLSNPGAIWPHASYYFRDFLVTFYPLRLFAAGELRAGRIPAWNPFIHEGTFQLPSFYPVDLLHVFESGPVFVSWLLTLHLPLAALAAYWLAREFGVGRAGALAAGVVYSLGGLTLSSLNLYVFLQALALAPLVAGTLRRAGRDGGSSVALAAVVLGAALSTMAVEFVAQAVLLGAALALATRWGPRTLLHLGVAGLVGVGLAGLPLGLTAGFLPETVRGAGFDPSVALGNALHPAVLLQTVLPNLFGLLASPAGAWWGSGFYTKGFPYFLSVYVGPLTLALAAVGTSRLERRTRWVLLGLGSIGVWYALGEWGGLATVLARIPGASSFRFPVKAVLLPFLVVAIAAGAGVDRLTRERSAWTWLAAALAVVSIIVLGTTTIIAVGGAVVAAWSGVDRAFWPTVVAVVRGDAIVATGLLGGAALVTWAVLRNRVGLPMAGAALVGVLATDLARAGAGMNPQIPASFFERLPELEEVDEGARRSGRVFSYGIDHSPAYRKILSRGGAGVGLAGFFLHRQMLGPYTNIIDRIETPESTDLTSFVTRPRDLSPEDYDPARAARLIPWMRNAAVGTVLSLDPLVDPALEPAGQADAGPPGLVIHAYRVRDPSPKAYVACRALIVADPEAGMAAPYRRGFDGGRDVAVEVPAIADCGWGRVSMEAQTSRQEVYRVDLDGRGLLVVRGSWARGWKVRVDGEECPVLRGNGKHRAVAVGTGSHRVDFEYEPPGLMAGAVVSLLALGALGAFCRWAPKEGCV